MTPVKDCQNMTSEELRKEIKTRNDLINQMVGTLYPGIVADEIAELYDLLEAKRIADLGRPG